jgi:hypothetical protein
MQALKNINLINLTINFQFVRCNNDNTIFDTGKIRYIGNSTGKLNIEGGRKSAFLLPETIARP